MAHRHAVVHLNRWMPVRHAAASWYQDMESTVHQGQYPRVPASTINDGRAVTVGLFLKCLVMGLQGATLKTGALDHGYARLQKVMGHSAHLQWRHTHQSQVDLGQITDVRDADGVLQSVSQKSRKSSTLNHPSQCQLRIIEQSQCTGAAKFSGANHCHLQALWWFTHSMIFTHCRRARSCLIPISMDPTSVFISCANILSTSSIVTMPISSS